jgi:hypothetical protein
MEENPCEHLICGYKVYFSEGRKPFPAQLAVISKVLQALKDKKNALLESPTGTGKVHGQNRFTLSLSIFLYLDTGSACKYSRLSAENV